MQNTVNKKLLHSKVSLTRFVYIFMKNLTRSSKLLKISRYWGLKETVTSFKQRFGLSVNQRQNILPKAGTSSKIGQDFDICFCARFDCNCQKQIFEKRLDISLCVHPILRFTFHFLSLSTFGNSYYTSIKYHFFVWQIKLSRKHINL